MGLGGQGGLSQNLHGPGQGNAMEGTSATSQTRAEFGHWGCKGLQTSGCGKMSCSGETPPWYLFVFSLLFSG